MSSHYIDVVMHNGTTNQIQIGFDQRLDWAFLVITPYLESNKKALGNPIYTNLDEMHPEDLNLDHYIKVVLKRFGITLPEKMISALEDDVKMKTGNKEVVWHEG